MRLWHKDLIQTLPREQLVAQWRECSAIAGTIEKNGTPNHGLVNYVTEYPANHLITYSSYIMEELKRRGYRASPKVMDKINSLDPYAIRIGYDELFKNHHDNLYTTICLWNLYEKEIRGMLSKNDLPFNKILIP